MQDSKSLAHKVENGEVTALLFDLDGVLTPTTDLHKAAWSDLFTPFLEARGVAPYTEDDYYAHIDGKARIDGVASLLASRGISLPPGGPEQGEASGPTIWGMAEDKNANFASILQTEGITPYPGSAAFLEHVARFEIPMAVVSSSKNARDVLELSGLADYFPVVVDGVYAVEQGLPGKPFPDTYLAAASLVGSSPEQAIVFEDALSGVAAGRAGHFAHVVGVDRGAGAQALRASGATVVVSDLSELIPAGPA